MREYKLTNDRQRSIVALPTQDLFRTGQRKEERMQKQGSKQHPTTRVRLLFDADWLFFQGDVAGAQEIDYDDRTWRQLNLPHDWSIEGSFS